MGFLKGVRDETEDEGEIEAEKRALRELLLTFRVRSEIEVPDLAEDERAQEQMGYFIAHYAVRRQRN